MRIMENPPRAKAVLLTKPRIEYVGVRVEGVLFAAMSATEAVEHPASQTPFAPAIRKSIRGSVTMANEAILILMTIWLIMRTRFRPYRSARRPTGGLATTVAIPITMMTVPMRRSDSPWIVV